MVDLAESALSKSFLDARENVCNKVLLKTADFIDDATPQSLAKDYISRKPDIRIPYSQDATFYRDIKQEMLQEFRKSCFWHILTGGNDEDAENMVVRYLGTPFTFKPKRELA
ncbi:MAG: hypothetical protein A3J37_03195 [Alphaproteobacteria bacterium RIFCSPHIGHO2_12_FULL_45_9]|nr:MAG: hypothetical protein A3J37_03195 [Alphaproteobacteria bacterium RIFCSPHIGHO2_12_FULL_45_9]